MSASSKASSKEFLVFEIANRLFGVPLAEVEEVVPATQITKVPNSAPFLLGLTAVRGKVMGTIDAARRYNLSGALNGYFMVCRVRGNLTAVTIDRPVLAGNIFVRELSAEVRNKLIPHLKVDPKFLKEVYELFETPEEGQEPKSTGKFFFVIDNDLFVSAEMASRIGEAA